MTPKHIQNRAFLKMLLRSCTTALLKVLTPKKINAKEYKIKKYQFNFIKPVNNALVTAHIKKKLPAMIIKVRRFLLNRPQL
jgi:hypothetical protein